MNYFSCFINYIARNVVCCLSPLSHPWGLLHGTLDIPWLCNGYHHCHILLDYSTRAVSSDWGRSLGGHLCIVSRSSEGSGLYKMQGSSKQERGLIIDLAKFAFHVEIWRNFYAVMGKKIGCSPLGQPPALCSSRKQSSTIDGWDFTV